MQLSVSSFFFFNDTATTEIYTLSLHDALPILLPHPRLRLWPFGAGFIHQAAEAGRRRIDRKSTRLNSSHQIISYAVFCLKKKKIKATIRSLLLSLNTSPTVHSFTLSSIYYPFT